MASVVAEIPGSAVGEHNSHVGRYVFGDEARDSFIGEEITEILQVETAQAVLFLQRELQSGVSVL